MRLLVLVAVAIFLFSAGALASGKRCHHRGGRSLGDGDEKCYCLAGWTGEECDQCATPLRHQKYICVATRDGYELAYVTTTQYKEIMSGQLRLNAEARHKSIDPDSVGFDGRRYDCGCKPE